MTLNELVEGRLQVGQFSSSPMMFPSASMALFLHSLRSRGGCRSKQTNYTGKALGNLTSFVLDSCKHKTKQQL